jgi:hypothetical protein
MIDFLPFYESAKASNFVTLEQLKELIEDLLHKRIAQGKAGKVLIFDGAARFLSAHCHFDKSIELEGWWNNAHMEWRKNNLNITIICSTSFSTVLSGESILSVRSKIGDVHSATL